MKNDFNFEPYNGLLPEPEAVDFIQYFLETQYQVTMAKAREDLNQEGFAKEVSRLDGLYREGLKSGVVRGKQPGDKGFADFTAQFQIKAQRTCFLIRVYEHAELGRVYRFYAGTDRVKGTQYFVCYYCAEIEDRFQILAECQINSAHTVWEWSQGKKWTEGALRFTAVWRLSEPVHETDQKDYKSDMGLDAKGTMEPRPVKLPSLENSIVTEDKAAFIRQFGSIKEDTKANAVLGSEGLLLLGGCFYTSGFFRDGKAPDATELPWKKLTDAVEFANGLEKLLQSGDCTALDSEGDSPYVPFVYLGEMLLDGLPDFAARDEVPQGAKIFYDTADERACIFWPDELEEDIRETLDTGDGIPSLQAYLEADQRMRAVLTNRVTFQIERSTQTPCVLGGTFCPGIFAGVVTLCIRT